MKIEVTNQMGMRALTGGHAARRMGATKDILPAIKEVDNNLLQHYKQGNKRALDLLCLLYFLWSF